LTYHTDLACGAQPVVNGAANTVIPIVTFKPWLGKTHYFHFIIAGTAGGQAFYQEADSAFVPPALGVSVAPIIVGGLSQGSITIVNPLPWSLAPGQVRHFSFCVQLQRVGLTAPRQLTFSVSGDKSGADKVRFGWCMATGSR
jgi:hypothetical protein